MTHEAGKGDKPRPTNWDHFSENFDRIFGKKQLPEPHFKNCERCGKDIWVDPLDAYSGIHTCTPKQNVGNR